MACTALRARSDRMVPVMMGLPWAQAALADLQPEAVVALDGDDADDGDGGAGLGADVLVTLHVVNRVDWQRCRVVPGRGGAFVRQLERCVRVVSTISNKCLPGGDKGRGRDQHVTACTAVEPLPQTLPPSELWG